jgi:hypothetical protein
VFRGQTRWYNLHIARFGIQRRGTRTDLSRRRLECSLARPCALWDETAGVPWPDYNGVILLLEWRDRASFQLG